MDQHPRENGLFVIVLALTTGACFLLHRSEGTASRNAGQLQNDILGAFMLPGGMA